LDVTFFYSKNVTFFPRGFHTNAIYTAVGLFTAVYTTRLTYGMARGGSVYTVYRAVITTYYGIIIGFTMMVDPFITIFITTFIKVFISFYNVIYT
jgi:hypothetical protein